MGRKLWKEAILATPKLREIHVGISSKGGSKLVASIQKWAPKKIGWDIWDAA